MSSPPEAANGLEALEHARQQPPDRVISDILMPQMDGFALCRASRTDPALALTPFLFYTGTYASANDVARARRLGAARFRPSRWPARTSSVPSPRHSCPPKSR